jgi:hypothetical protein
VIKIPIAAKGVLAVVVSSMGDQVHVYSTDAGAKLSFDGQPAVVLSPDGVDLQSVSAGAHELNVTSAGEQYKLAIEVAAAPALTAFVESGQNVGTLVVLTGQDKTQVFLNGKALPQLTQGSQLRIPNLEPKEYSVRVAKAGFQDVPEQKIRIRKGDQGKLTFTLIPVQHVASLSIQGAPAGATVLIDQAVAGTVQPDGTFKLPGVAPGDHSIELRKDGFKPRQIKRHFVADSAVTLAAGDSTLEAAPGELRITFTPADAQVTLIKAGESPIKVTSGAPLNLPGGTYTLIARTADDFQRTSPLELSAGQSRNLELSLTPDGMSKWEDPAGWKQEKGVYVRKGGEYVLYGAPSSGTFRFSAMLMKGHRLQWVVNYTDQNNYDLFQIDENNFYRTDIRNGQKVNEVKVPQKGDKKSFRTFMIHVSPTEIVHQIQQGNGWVLLDRWTQPGTNLSSGKFGFYLPGGDQISLANFSHYVDLNLR